MLMQSLRSLKSLTGISRGRLKARALLAGLLTICLMSLVAAPRAQATPLACSWNLVPSPNAGTSDNILYGVTAVSTSNVWAVGEQFANTIAGVEAQTLTEQWNGANWTVIPSPNVGSGDVLYSVAAKSANNIWAVGAYWDVFLGANQTLTIEWNGGLWNVFSSPNVGVGDNALSGVARVPGSNTVWAVGDYYDASIGLYQTLIEQWNGSSWQIVPSPNLGSAFNELLGVTAVSANNVWAVGDYNHSQTLIEHWNGSIWRVIPSPTPSGSSYAHLSSVAAVSANNVWAVGSSSDSAGNARTLTERWNGSSWKIISTPNVSAVSNNLSGVAAVSASNIWAVGNTFDSTSNAGQTLSEHWNGTSWQIVPSPDVSPTFNVFYGAARVPGSTAAWAVGDDNNSTPAAQTLTAFHC